MKIQETMQGIPVPNIIGTVRLGELGIEELTQLLQTTYDKGMRDAGDASWREGAEEGYREGRTDEKYSLAYAVPEPVEMPVNPLTGLYNVTPEEVDDARAATEDVILVREDGTLTKAGQLYVADVRRHIANGE